MSIKSLQWRHTADAVQKNKRVLRRFLKVECRCSSNVGWQTYDEQSKMHNCQDSLVRGTTRSPRDTEQGAARVGTDVTGDA